MQHLLTDSRQRTDGITCTLYLRVGIALGFVFLVPYSVFTPGAVGSMPHTESRSNASDLQIVKKKKHWKSRAMGINAIRPKTKSILWFACLVVVNGIH